LSAERTNAALAARLWRGPELTDNIVDEWRGHLTSTCPEKCWTLWATIVTISISI